MWRWLAAILRLPCFRAPSRHASAAHPRLSAGLPLLDGIEWPQKHDDVEGEIVADHIADEKLKQDSDRHGEPDRKPRGEHEAHNHGERVEDGIDDAIAVIVE